METYLKEQIITYIGNKRVLLNDIEDIVIDVKNREKKDKLVCLDLFSGSGIVARMLKSHSSFLIANDLEAYSEIINNCYLTNHSQFPNKEYEEYKKKIEESPPRKGIISKYYSPKDDMNIKEGERVFYTNKNATLIDTYRKAIEDIPHYLQKYFLGPLLYAASVHVNTGGVFKGFYKDGKKNIGKYGGKGENALERIKGQIELKKPIFSKMECPFKVYRKDANELVKDIKNIDITYIDPPYNQHPYGSNYFMLNIIGENKISDEISKVSGIPKNWNRSIYNSKRKAANAFDNLIGNLSSKYIIVSYNSEGFISAGEMIDILGKYGSLEVKEKKYNTYKASRNLNDRNIHVKEYLFLLTKNTLGNIIK